MNITDRPICNNCGAEKPDYYYKACKNCRKSWRDNYRKRRGEQLNININRKIIEDLIHPYTAPDDLLLQGMVCNLTLKQQKAIVMARKALND